MRADGPDVAGRRISAAGRLHGVAGAAGGHPWRRYVALGDSFTEGVGDPVPGSPGVMRGWADRVAEELAAGQEDFAYANLAVRGLLLEQILSRQVGPALALEPDLVSLSAGGNDMVFHGSDPDKLAGKLETGVAVLAQTGATVVLFTGPEWASTPVLGRNRAKVAIFNEDVRAIAYRHHAVVADLWAIRQLADRRMWDPDRLHLSPLGHHTVAAMVLDTLNVAHSLQPMEPKDLPEGSWRQARTEDLRWAKDYLLPWALRQIRPHAREEVARRAKRPEAVQVLPVTGGLDRSPAVAEG
ncbi:SGNH/GDSL hydrolase family protein [Arthrobacter sp. MPF02]|uniref:SGNH/GDSL hydrolase family protein n=1 Tax=Arthrobacter sp. MPF02 TaxID=3388492 RepID=UPI0039848ECA